jgi:methyl-accepting chemotaxis protein
MSPWRTATQLRLLVGVLAALLLGTGALALHAIGAAEGATGLRLATGLSMALGVLLAVAGSSTITRGISRQLGAEPDEAAALAHRVAAGDLDSPTPPRADDSTSLMAGLLGLQSGLGGLRKRLRRDAEQVATASARFAAGHNDLRARTGQQAGALQQTAASMAQLAATVEQSADKARQANQAALGASAVALQGGQVVGQVVDTMKSIDAASKRIADIVGVIDGIAFQTNILALNAAVEAARAGEQGRGFAVVAAEVRSLAQRSADAAREIKGLIGASVERVEQGTALADQAGATMGEVVTAIRRVTDLMGEISATSSAQSAGMAQVGDAVRRMDQATQHNATLVEHSAAAAESLQQQATRLLQAVTAFEAGADEARVDPPLERRGPDRAHNVTRPDFGARAAAPRQASAATGTDDR